MDSKVKDLVQGSVIETESGFKLLSPGNATGIVFFLVPRSCYDAEKEVASVPISLARVGIYSIPFGGYLAACT